jgi:hypothetical protein
MKCIRNEWLAYFSCALQRTEQHEAVLELARRLDKNSNPASLQRCADYLASHRHYDAAVDLLAMAGKVRLEFRYFFYV